VRRDGSGWIGPRPAPGQGADASLGFVVGVGGIVVVVIVGRRVSPPGSMGTNSTGITGDHGTTF
jgi:hypothetical protein